MAGGRSEVRWFVPGELPDTRALTGAPRRRRDAYDLCHLTPATSVKRRGQRARIEWKLRVGRVELVDLGAVVGFAESWVKYREDPPHEATLGERWLDVDKEVWSAGRLEVARLEIAGEPWWTVALCDGDHAVARRLLEPWTGWLVDGGVASSYPAWLLDVVARRPALASAA